MNKLEPYRFYVGKGMLPFYTFGDREPAFFGDYRAETIDLEYEFDESIGPLSIGVGRLVG